MSEGNEVVGGALSVVDAAAKAAPKAKKKPAAKAKKRAPLRLADAPEFCSTRQAAEILGVSIDLVRSAIKSTKKAERLHSVRIGRRVLIPRAALEGLAQVK